MAQSLSQILVHIVFSTKNRIPFLEDRQILGRTFQDEFRTLLHRYDIEYDERYVWD